MTDFPVSLDSSQLLSNNTNGTVSTHQHHHHQHSPQSSKPQPQQQQQQPFPNLEVKKNGIVYIKSSNSLRNGSAKSSTTLSRSTSSNGVSSPSVLDMNPNPHVTSNTSTNSNTSGTTQMGRKRSNSQSQVVSMPAKPKYTTATTSRDQSKGLSNGNSSLLTKSSPGPSPLNPRKRNQVQYYVTLLPLNDTFVKKHLPVATYPETTKLGRPTGTKHKPDVTNGYFDSRVLSRNHAQIYIDPKNGKLMLQDLGSSNGTYLNDARLNNDPTEVKMGDIVCLGFNVQAESTHKQISLKIENINVISTSLTGDKDSTANNGTKSNNKDLHIFSKDEGFDSPEFKQLAFVEDIYQQIEHQQQNKRSNESVFPNIITFDDALFADVNEEALRDYSLNAGIYNNSQITTTSNMEQIINLLINDLARVKQQASSLNALSNFFQNYYRKLDRLNQDYLDHQVKNKLAQVEHELSKEKAFSVKLKDKFKLFESETNKNIDGLNIKLKKCDEEKIQLTNLFKDLQCKNESLEQEIRALEEEKSKHMKQEESLNQFMEALSNTPSGIIGSNSQELQPSPQPPQDDESKSINGFIEDLSHTPSVSKNLDLMSRDELTPPASEDEEEEEHEQEERESSDSEEISDEKSSVAEDNRDDEVKSEFESIVATNSIPKDDKEKEAEPFPTKMEETGKKSSSSFTTTRSTSTSTSARRKLSAAKIENIQTFGIALSAMLVGYFLQNIVGKIG
ncbi:hypothetical protein G210_2846 [Candida maltosa Xu316]|uniref:FHA domain-containing protein n=1 Tax=Candida maltosa (strain Xu316) TaxID=1245528 RepID=M3HHU4_CANMX|nr:hypothetical protein G210_2846 [Candida maltosa Xu316]